jgi:hypothetical protein
LTAENIIPSQEPLFLDCTTEVRMLARTTSPSNLLIQLRLADDKKTSHKGS